MDHFQFKPDEYLQRIKLQAGVSVSLDSLRKLHWGQLSTIPFENFDICLGRGIELSPSHLFNKLVCSKRGGYCFELNGLLLMALQYFRFDARALLGRVHLGGTPTGRGHQFSLVTLEDGQWLVDAGFGADTPREPVPFGLDEEFAVRGKTLRLQQDDLYGYMLQVRKDDSWANLYSFDLNHVCAGDIAYGNHFTSTNPTSSFVVSRTASLPTETGLNTLRNFTLKKRENGKETVQELEEGQAYIDALQENFGIELDEPYDNLKEVVQNESAR